ncbi:expressed unknown protein [Seminavis robusta]|uniref:Uncharacterized protein n=1 Tax=Seminavis robusta TaxID=568900 RepID=A0A9N8HM76_9STRA|nr:expressed unknown protein [Seminavis robusta]|eukprot:Sro725_g193250.1 n/a (227) ;mRNA; r:3686-4366
MVVLEPGAPIDWSYEGRPARRLVIDKAAYVQDDDADGDSDNNAVPDVDHPLSKTLRQIPPDSIYLWCSYCDHCREVTPNSFKKDKNKKQRHSLEDIICGEPDKMGRRPVIQELDQKAVRDTGKWKKMRGHWFSCLQKRWIVHHPEVRAVYEKDKMALEKHIAPLFRNSRRKYSQLDTVTSDGKANGAFYKRQSNKNLKARAQKEWEDKARSTWMNASTNNGHDTAR